MTQNEEKKQYKFFQTPKILKKLDPYEWVLFTVLFDEWQMMKNEEGWFFRSEEELSEDTGLSPATIYRRTKSLEEKGLILVKRHSDGKTKSEKYKSNDYKINIETVISLAPIESHQREIESHQRDEPTNNIPTNKQYKINNINIITFEDRTPDNGTLQDDEVESVYLNISDDDWLSYEVKRSMMDEVNNNLKLNDMKKENEMSDNGTNAMNAISEQSERQAKENESSGCGKENEMATPTSGDKNNTSREIHNIPVDKSKVINNDRNVQGVIPNAKDCAPAPATEEWKPVVGYEDLYEVSNLGRVKRLARWFKTKGESEQWRKELIVTPTLNEKGYQRVELYDIDGKRKKYRVHRLVAEAFIPNPYNLPQVNHKDENKQNNFVYINEDGTVNMEKSNLEWCTNQYNVTYSIGKPVIQYTADGTIVNTYNSISQAVRETGYSEQTITKSCKGYNTFGHKWKYVEPSAWDEDAIFGSGERQNVSVDNLSTQGKKTQPEPQECPQNETDVFNRISEILEEALIITDVEPFKAKLQEALDLLKQIRPSANRNAFTRCCDDTIYWYTQNNWDDWDMFSVASDFKRDIERMKRA